MSCSTARRFTTSTYATEPDAAWAVVARCATWLRAGRGSCISTNYVFDGRRASPTARTTSAPGLDLRADKPRRRTRGAGVRRGALPCAARGCTAVARKRLEGRNFVTRMLARAGEPMLLLRVSNQRLQPRSRRPAAAVLEAVEREATGVVHLTAGGACSWLVHGRDPRARRARTSGSNRGRRRLPACPTGAQRRARLSACGRARITSSVAGRTRGLHEPYVGPARIVRSQVGARRVDYTVMRRFVPLLAAVVASCALGVPSALANASKADWPVINGMLLINAADGARPLDGRPGHDPFGGQDPTYSWTRSTRTRSASAAKTRSSASSRSTTATAATPTTGSLRQPRRSTATTTSCSAGTQQHDLRRPQRRRDLGRLQALGLAADAVQPTYGGPGNDVIYAAHGTSIIDTGKGDRHHPAHRPRQDHLPLVATSST